MIDPSYADKVGVIRSYTYKTTATVMKCDICGEKISMWSTPYKVGNKTLCKDCCNDAELVEKVKAQSQQHQQQSNGSQLSEREVARRAASKILLTSTPEVPGAKVTEIFDLVFGEAIIGANVFSDAFASVRDIVGGRSNSYQKRFREARQIAVEEVALDAHRKGANAVVGVSVDYEMVGESMMMVTASGTAVRIEGEPTERKETPHE